MDNQSFIPITMCLSKVTLAAGTTTTISNTGTTVFAIRGKAYSKTAMTNVATPTTDWATGAAFSAVKTDKGSVVMIGLDSDGTVRAIQGTITDLDATGAFINAPQFGGTGPSGSGTGNGDFCPIGYLVIKAGSTAAAAGWVFGTNNNSSVTGITYTFVDVCGWPDRPQIS
mgnify:CR=1 FL=1